MSTLKEKFYKEIRFMERAEICEKIADDYAIDLLQWIRYNAIETNTGWQFNKKSYTDAEILKIFKKQNGY